MSTRKYLPLLTMLVPESDLHEISHPWDILMSYRGMVVFDDKTVAPKINCNYRKTSY